MSKWALLLIPVFLAGCVNIKIDGHSWSKVGDTKIPEDAKPTTSRNIVFKVPGQNFKFEIENISGNIHVFKSKGKDIRVELHYPEKALEYLKIYEYRRSNEAGVLVKKRSKFIERIPRDVHIDMDIYVPDSLAGIELSSVNGDISIPNTIYANSYDLSSVSGDIKGNLNSYEIAVATVNGDIKLFLKSKSIDVSTVNGDVKLNITEFKSAEISGVNASVYITIPSGLGMVVTCSSINGSVEVTPSSSARILEDSGHFFGKSKKLIIGDGSASMSINTVNGSIHITVADSTI